MKCGSLTVLTHTVCTVTCRLYVSTGSQPFYYETNAFLNTPSIRQTLRTHPLVLGTPTNFLFTLLFWTQICFINSLYVSSGNLPLFSLCPFIHPSLMTSHFKGRHLLLFRRLPYRDTGVDRRSCEPGVCRNKTKFLVNSNKVIIL